MNEMPDSAVHAPAFQIGAAGFGQRLGAYLLDMVVFWVVFLLLVRLLQATTTYVFPSTRSAEGAWIVPAMYMLYNTYYLLSELFMATTLGKKLAGTAPVDHITYWRITPKQALLRALVRAIPAPVLVLVTRNGAMLHDRLSGTMVVRQSALAQLRSGLPLGPSAFGRAF